LRFFKENLENWRLLFKNARLFEECFRKIEAFSVMKGILKDFDAL
jgi:hypothetical protein